MIVWEIAKMAAVIKIIYDLINKNVFADMIKEVGSIATYGATEAAFIAAIYNVIAPAAFGLLIAYTLYGILSKAIELGESPTLNTVLSPVIRLVIAYLLLMNADRLIGAFMGMSNSLIDNVPELTMAAQDMMGEPDGAKSFFAKVIFYVLGLGAVAIANVFPVIMVIIEAVKIKVMFIVMLAFMPFAIVNICGHEHRGGIRYIKRLIGNAFMLFAIITELYIASAISMQMRPGDGLVEMIVELAVYKVALPFCAVKIIGLTKRTVESVVE